MKKLLITIVVIVVVVLVALALKKGSQKSDTAVVTDTPQTSASPTTSASPLVVVYASPDADWAVYTSASAGFSFSYPKDWKEKSCGPSCVGLTTATEPNDFVMGVSISSGSLETMLSQAGPYIQANETVPVSGITWHKLTLRQPDTGAVFTSYFTSNKNFLYEISLSPTGVSHVAEFGKVITSFKFLK